MDQQVALIIILALVGLGRWLLQKSGELRESRRLQESLDQLDEPNPPTIESRPNSPAPYQDDVNAERRLREALGLPHEEILTWPAMVKAPPPLPAPIVIVPQQAVPAPTHGTRRKTVASVPVVIERSTVREMLRTPHGLREAIILAEVLGPPKALS